MRLQLGIEADFNLYRVDRQLLNDMVGYYMVATTIRGITILLGDMVVITILDSNSNYHIAFENGGNYHVYRYTATILCLRSTTRVVGSTAVSLPYCIQYGIYWLAV
jgi:hypothetical protein